MKEQATGSRGSGRVRFKRWLETAATLAFIGACGAVVWSVVRGAPPMAPARVPPARRPAAAPAIPSQPISIEGAALKGNPAAIAVLAEYSEFQCPYCGEFARRILPEIERTFVQQGQLAIAFLHFPLEAIHPRARPAAEAAECAGQQGKFWDLHDLFFADQKSLDDSTIELYATRLGLNEKAFAKCRTGGAGAAPVTKHLELGHTVQVQGTPTVLIGKREVDGRMRVRFRIAGARPFEEFRTAIDKVLQEAR
jgi:protein-disulfide isomerase